MATEKKYGACHKDAQTSYQMEGDVITIRAFPIGQEIEPPADQVTTMKVVNSETGLRLAAGIAFRHKQNAMKECDRHAAIAATLTNLADEKEREREAIRKAEHQRNYVADEIWGHPYALLSIPARTAIDEIIKLRAEVTEKGVNNNE